MNKTKNKKKTHPTPTPLPPTVHPRVSDRVLLPAARQRRRQRARQSDVPAQPGPRPPHRAHRRPRHLRPGLRDRVLLRRPPERAGAGGGGGAAGRAGAAAARARRPCVPFPARDHHRRPCRRQDLGHARRGLRHRPSGRRCDGDGMCVAGRARGVDRAAASPPRLTASSSPSHQLSGRSRACAERPTRHEGRG